MDGREAKIRRWFDMWLRQEDTGIMELFDSRGNTGRCVRWR